MLPGPKLHAAASNKKTGKSFTLRCTLKYAIPISVPEFERFFIRRLLLGGRYANPQLAQLARFDGGRRVSQHANRALAFWKSDHIAQRLGAAQEHCETIDTEGDAAMGRRAETQRLKEKPELRCRFVRADAHQAEDFFLQFHLVDTNAAAADLNAVKRQVVGFRARLRRIAVEQREVVVQRRRKRMMQSDVALFFGIEFHQRKIDDPRQ